MLREFDKSDWHVDDPQWMAERKALWREVEKRWLHAGTACCCRKEMPILRRYFLTGEIDWDEFALTQSRSFTLMLLHPRQEYETLHNIWSAMDSGGDCTTSVQHYKSAVSASENGANGFFYTGLGDQGLFYGKDELYASIFYGDICQYPTERDPHGYLYERWAYSPERFFVGFMNGADDFLLGVEIYPRKIEQYLIPLWRSSLSFYKRDFLEREEVIVNFMRYVRYWDRWLKEPLASQRRVFAARLTEVFEQDDLPPLLKDWWEQTADENQQDFSLIEERIADYQADVANRDNATSQTGIM